MCESINCTWMFVCFFGRMKGGGGCYKTFAELKWVTWLIC